jgi:hypothetical protein
MVPFSEIPQGNQRIFLSHLCEGVRTPEANFLGRVVEISLENMV